MDKDFLTIHDLAPEDVEAALDLAGHLKAMQQGGVPHRYLEGRTLGMIFEKSSTRTRVSFEVGMYQLGGSALFLSSHDTQLGRGEPIRDTQELLVGLQDYHYNNFEEFFGVPLEEVKANMRPRMVITKINNVIEEYLSVNPGLDAHVEGRITILD